MFHVVSIEFSEAEMHGRVFHQVFGVVAKGGMSSIVRPIPMPFEGFVPVRGGLVFAESIDARRWTLNRLKAKFLCSISMIPNAVTVRAISVG